MWSSRSSIATVTTATASTPATTPTAQCLDASRLTVGKRTPADGLRARRRWRTKLPRVNVLGGELAPCSFDPVTGFFRDGSCRTEGVDPGFHAVCAVMTEEFLEFTRLRGNDLVTPQPEWSFPGLRPGDRWCVVAAR